MDYMKFKCRQCGYVGEAEDFIKHRNLVECDVKNDSNRYIRHYGEGE